MTTNVSPEKLAIIRAALPGTRNDIAERTGLARSTCGYGLAILVQQRRAHVGAWEKSGQCRPRQVYVAGDGDAAAKPDMKTPYRPRERKREPIAYSLRPRIDPMIWATAGREVRA